ncbi:hypothetical protein ACVPPR_07350 [Dellaglioa sp. L3N]
MIKTYKKIANIQAEQFDGSQEMIDKYKIQKIRTDPDNEYYIATSDGIRHIEIGDWIITDTSIHVAIKNKIRVMSNYTFQATYEEV